MPLALQLPQSSTADWFSTAISLELRRYGNVKGMDQHQKSTILCLHSRPEWNRGIMELFQKQYGSDFTSHKKTGTINS